MHQLNVRFIGFWMDTANVGLQSYGAVVFKQLNIWVEFLKILICFSINMWNIIYVILIYQISLTFFTKLQYL